MFDACIHDFDTVFTEVVMGAVETLVGSEASGKGRRRFGNFGVEAAPKDSGVVKREGQAQSDLHGVNGAGGPQRGVWRRDAGVEGRSRGDPEGPCGRRRGGDASTAHLHG